MALMVVMVLGALLVVPGVRSFVIDAYGTVVSIFAGDPDKNPPEVPTVTPIEAWNPHLAGETDLGTLISQGMKVMLPQGMPEPDHVYSQFGSEPMILSVWLDRDQAGKPGMALYQFAAHKMELVENLERFVRYRTDIYIGKWKGVWIEGQCKIELAYVEPGGFNRTSSKQLVEGNTLVWFDMEFLQTYVLVGDMSMEEAISIATTVQTPSVIPTPYPTPTPVSHVSRLDLFGETRLSNLSIASGFVPRIPVVEEMPELVAPDRVYLQGSPGLPDSAQVVIMAWLVPKQPDDIRLVLTQGIVDVTVWPDDASGVQTATVNGNGAKWLQAPQKAYVNGPDGKPVQAERSFLTNGYVLVWQEDGLYFRLETTLSLGEAVRLAESLVP
jgi:hypothetical protein